MRGTHDGRTDHLATRRPTGFWDFWKLAGEPGFAARLDVARKSPKTRVFKRPTPAMDHAGGQWSSSLRRDLPPPTERHAGSDRIGIMIYLKAPTRRCQGTFVTSPAAQDLLGPLRNDPLPIRLKILVRSNIADHESESVILQLRLEYIQLEWMG